MKAEERHRLQQNTLATGLTKLATETKSASSSFWGVLILLVAVAVCYWWWTRNTTERLASSWVHYWETRSLAERLQLTPKDDLEDTMKSFQDKPPAHAAKLTYADELYEKGYQTTFNRSPVDAGEFFQGASVAYEDLASVTGVPMDVSIRAVIGAAKCQESLGEIDRAKHFYAEVIRRFDDAKSDDAPHPLVAEAKRRKAQLDSPEGLAFYGKGADRPQWPQRVPPVTRSFTPPPIPSGEALPDLKPPAFPEAEKTSDAPPKAPPSAEAEKKDATTPPQKPVDK